jgi:hypothetical protein
MVGQIGRWQSLALAAALAATGCTTTGTQAYADASPASGSMEVITRSEINRAQWSDTYELVRNLRPRWVRARVGDHLRAGRPEVQVYVDGTRLGGVTLLRGIPTSGIDHMQWVDPISAAGRWGFGHELGVIAISYRPANR